MNDHKGKRRAREGSDESVSKSEPSSLASGPQSEEDVCVDNSESEEEIKEQNPQYADAKKNKNKGRNDGTPWPSSTPSASSSSSPSAEMPKFHEPGQARVLPARMCLVCGDYLNVNKGTEMRCDRCNQWCHAFLCEGEMKRMRCLGGKGRRGERGGRDRGDGLPKKKVAKGVYTGVPPRLDRLFRIRLKKLGASVSGQNGEGGSGSDDGDERNEDGEVKMMDCEVWVDGQFLGDKKKKEKKMRKQKNAKKKEERKRRKGKDRSNIARMSTNHESDEEEHEKAIAAKPKRKKDSKKKKGKQKQDEEKTQRKKKKKKSEKKKKEKRTKKRFAGVKVESLEDLMAIGEICSEILKYLSLVDLIMGAQLVCKRWRSFIHNSGFWRNFGFRNHQTLSNVAIHPHNLTGCFPIPVKVVGNQLLVEQMWDAWLGTGASQRQRESASEQKEEIATFQTKCASDECTTRSDLMRVVTVKLNDTFVAVRLFHCFDAESAWEETRGGGKIIAFADDDDNSNMFNDQNRMSSKQKPRLRAVRSPYYESSSSRSSASSLSSSGSAIRSTATPISKDAKPEKKDRREDEVAATVFYRKACHQENQAIAILSTDGKRRYNYSPENNALRKQFRGRQEPNVVVLWNTDPQLQEDNDAEDEKVKLAFAALAHLLASPELRRVQKDQVMKARNRIPIPAYDPPDVNIYNLPKQFKPLRCFTSLIIVFAHLGYVPINFSLRGARFASKFVFLPLAPAGAIVGGVGGVAVGGVFALVGGFDDAMDYAKYGAISSNGDFKILYRFLNGIGLPVNMRDCLRYR